MLANAEDLLNDRIIESSRVEYKGNWNPERVLHTICAFANDIDNIGGGYIIVGVNEVDGMPVIPVKGIDKGTVDGINKELLNICNLIEPRYIPSTKHQIIDGKDVLIIEVIVGDSRPYKCPDSISKDKNKRGGKSYYIRKLANTIIADVDDERRLFNIASNTPFDCRVNYDVDVDQIRSSLIFEYLSKINSDDSSIDKPMKTILRDLKIVGSPPNENHPLNAGLLFFNERPTNFFEYARIEIVDMPDPTGDGMSDTVFNGPLDIQLEMALEYIRTNYIKAVIDKDQDTPVSHRTCNYPLAAIDEALTNAVYHRDYTINEPITVTVRPDRISIMSFPGPDRSISDEDIASFNMATTRYRNARIGDLLKHRGLAEKRGTGIATMLRSLERNGSQEPIFETDPERTFFRVTFLVHKRYRPADTGATVSIRKSADDLRQDILNILRDQGPTSMRELTDLMGYSRNARNVYDMVRRLISDGRVEYTHPDKPSSRNQRIRLKI